MEEFSQIWECAQCPVREFTIICDLKGDDLVEFQQKVKKHKFQGNQLIFTEGDKIADLYIIMHGRVKLYYESIEGKEQVVDILGPGAVFGNISLSADSRCDVSAEAYGEGVYCSISLDYYQQLVQNKPQVAIRLLSVLESKLTKSRKIIRDLSLKRAQERMFSIIKTMAKEEGKMTTAGIEINLPLSVQMLSFMTGLTKETASRLVSEMRRQEIISLKKGKLIILNYEALC